jgi:hypothetical protein
VTLIQVWIPNFFEGAQNAITWVTTASAAQAPASALGLDLLSSGSTSPYCVHRKDSLTK